MINQVSYIEICNAKIISVEKGNIKNPNVIQHVVAFTIGDKIDNKNIKVLLIGDIAKAVYWNFLDNFGTIFTEKTSFNVKLTKNVNVSLRGDIKEVRDKEIVIHNARDIVFNFEYKVKP
ncbi:MAG: hypothetical protein RBR68_07360 [Tenuifilaceae bacterium]|jgi:hypothetical protein|nr:hypothetical protein [Tenuifilaceae bacterium]